MRLRRVRKSLVRNDGRVFLDRWGIQWRPVGGIFLHRIDAPDPGRDLHDHPWSWVSIILRGGYLEERMPTDEAGDAAWLADKYPETCTRGVINWRGCGSIQRLRRTESHTICWVVPDRSTWTLMFVGPQRGAWGFYTPFGWVHEHDYDRENRRGMVAYERTPRGMAREVR